MNNLTENQNPSPMKKILFASGLVALMASAAQAQFTPGNLAVLRCGNGTNDVINLSLIHI